jgi:8-oxo-dGTP pyrophosphatase MutT (NUDIX family)/phosphohistidine phosphatase SixA
MVTAEGEETGNPEGHETVISEGENNGIPAAGALPWRRRNGQLEVALVHRPRYDDWSWPKGKLDPGEEWPVAAAREVWEETGCQVRLGRPLPSAQYIVEDRAGQRATKAVRYWAAELVGGEGPLVNEIDEVAWLDVAAATDRLSYRRDHEQLRALVRADHAWALATWPLVFVRHAKAKARSTWKHADPVRPLDARGREQAKALVPILAAFGVTRVVTSPSVRCLDTVLPYAVATGYGTHIKVGLSEEGFAERPGRATHHLTQLLERGEPAVLCSHGPVLPVLLEQLAAIADSGGSFANTAKVTLSEATRSGMGKGEVLVAHVVGTGPTARVVDIERYPAR